MQEIYQLQ